MGIYENIKELSDKKELSIQRLEVLSGLGNGTIGRWRTMMPHVDKLKSVADVLGVGVDRLIKD